MSNTNKNYTEFIEISKKEYDRLIDDDFDFDISDQVDVPSAYIVYIVLGMLVFSLGILFFVLLMLVS